MNFIGMDQFCNAIIIIGQKHVGKKAHCIRQNLCAYNKKSEKEIRIVLSFVRNGIQ